ncbi:MAG: transposase [Candidatus Aminicenantes bacterium]|nr:transposase [Candidatus Aminicenantes bacterium]
MSRPLRIEFPGAVYHITARGNERKAIFRNDQDKKSYLELLALVVKRFHWLCHGYCLMGNHYHLLIETLESNLSRGMKQLNGIYTQKFNNKYKRVGHLFQGRYKAILVEKESYLLELSRYIVLNPVRAGIVSQPEEWPWSSYCAIIGKVKKPEFLITDWILTQLGSDKIKAIEVYKNFVMSGYGIDFPHKELVGQIILGTKAFVKRVNSYLNKESFDNMLEIPREQQLSLLPQLEEIFQEEGRKGTPRDKIIYMVYYDYNFTMREIGEYLGLHYTTISRVINRYEKSEI